MELTAGTRSPETASSFDDLKKLLETHLFEQAHNY
jgi:hypothetical protein